MPDYPGFRLRNLPATFAFVRRVWRRWLGRNRLPTDLPGLLKAYAELETIDADYSGRTIAARKSARARLDALGLTAYDVNRRFIDLARQIEALDATALTPPMQHWLKTARREEDERLFKLDTAAEDAAVPTHDVGAWLQSSPMDDAAAVAWPRDAAESGCLAPGLTPLLDLRLDHPGLAFLKPPKGRLRVCLNRHNIWQPLLTRVKLDGSASLLTPLAPATTDDRDLEFLTPLYLRPGLVSAEQLVNGCCPTDLPEDERERSYVGGAPRWQQAAETPLCPDCRAPMTFLAQVAFAFGVFHYAFVCPKCLVAAALYQQD